MNALHPLPEPPVALWPEAGRTVRLLGWLCGLYGAAAAALAVSAALPAGAAGRSSGLTGLALSALLIPLAGLLASLPLAFARRRLGQPFSPAPPTRWRRFTRLRPLPAPQRLARLARRPQGIIVPVMSLAAAAAAGWLRPALADVTGGSILLGGSAIVLTFPLLVAERIVAGIRPARLPEAAALDALLMVPVFVIPAAGLLVIAAALGAAWTGAAMVAISVYLCLVAAELACRALANWFLPPPAPTAARAAVDSLAALLLQPGRMAAHGIAAPLRTHLGLDFSRSWAWRYVRSAALPVTVLIALVGWGLTGVTLLNLDQRGVYERFGAPVAVWQPGAHAGLPWPLGRVRPVELGVVHSLALGGDDPAVSIGAEEPAPAAADRVWDRAHPAEISYLIASPDTTGGQSFQSVSVDLRVLYGVGLDDASALRAAYAVADPAPLVRADTGRLLARFFAGQQLNDLLGENRETLAESLRAGLQAELDRQDSGLAIAAVVIEAIHPPVEAAEAYHNVQAAEIVANTAIATERGRAQAAAAMARQTAAGLTSDARGLAAETIAQASVLLRGFTADQDAARAGGRAFLLERYFANVSMALAKSPLVIVDHRLAGAEGPVIDLRSFGAPTGRGPDDD